MLPDKWFREIGSVLIAELKLPNFHLLRPPIGQYIAENAGEKTNPQGQIGINSEFCNKKRRRSNRGVFLSKSYIDFFENQTQS